MFRVTAFSVKIFFIFRLNEVDKNLKMASTMTRHPSRPPGSELSTNGSVNGSSSVSDGASDTPSEVELTVHLPDGRTTNLTVEYGSVSFFLILFFFFLFLFQCIKLYHVYAVIANHV